MERTASSRPEPLGGSGQRACGHCGALVFSDTRSCPQCRRFPVKLHLCPRCKFIADAKLDGCPNCGRLYEPGGDYL
jgi:RNA polymerase subunit RPABC4/transcription elongation factor Spt4